MTTITDPGAPAAQAIFLKGHLRLLALGMKNSRLSGKDILAKATAITGVAYKRGAYTQAIEDLQGIIDREVARREHAAGLRANDL